MSLIFEDMFVSPGVYFHVFPALNQGSRDVWDNMVTERDGRRIRMIDMFPTNLGFIRNESEMSITYTNGSRYQIMGAEDDKAIERLRGPNPVGVVFSEYAYMNPKAWEVLSPALAENNGWAAFISTPNIEDDHFHKVLKIAQQNEDRWFWQILTVDDTQRDAIDESGMPVITQDAITAERQDGKREEDIRREYYCEFQSYQYGTIYGDIMMAAERDNRITDIPYDPRLAVGVCADLGHSDHTALWFYQIYMNKKLFIDYWEGTQKEPKDIARVLREEKPYIYGRIVLPWDGRGASNYLEEVNFRNIHVCQRTTSLWSSIQDCRRELLTSYFDRTRCAIGIEHLKRYKSEFDETNRVFNQRPIHDHHSHGADAFRTGVEGGWEPLIFSSPWHGNADPIKIDSNFDPRLIGIPQWRP